MSRLKLRDDAYYVPTSDGIRILTNSGEAALTGPSIFQWIDRLAPHLDGSRSLGDLTAGMPADRRAMVERIINALQVRGIVVEVHDSAALGHTVTDAERRAFGKEIDLLGCLGPSAEQRFRAYRDCALVLIGSGRMLIETAAAARCSGSQLLRIVIADGSATDLTASMQHERHSGESDAEPKVVRCTVHPAAHEWTELIADAGLVIYAGNRSAIATVRALDAACAQAGVPFAAAIVAADEAWFGPLGPVVKAAPGWTGAWLRLLAHGEVNPAGQPIDDDVVAGPGPAVAANQFIREVMWLLTGVGQRPESDRMTRVNLRDLRTHHHRFLPHPFSLAVPRPSQAGLQARIEQLRAGERVAAEAFSQQVTACLQQRLGVLGEVSERDFVQLPLAVSQVAVSDPVRLLGPGTTLPVCTGAGLSLPEARRAAVLKGLATYASIMVDPRRLHTHSGVADPRTGDPAEDLAMLRDRRWTGFLWAQGLGDGRPHELAAVTVFPGLRRVLPARNRIRSGYQPPAGVAAGYDWNEATCAGLLGQCRRLTLAELAHRRTGVSPIDVHTVALDPIGDRYRGMALLTGERLNAYDVSGSLRVPTVALCLDDVALAYASGFSFADALRDGLAELLLSYQARVNDQADYAPARVPRLRRRLREQTLAPCPTWSTDQTGVLASLADHGWTAVAVPLDHDPAVTDTILPYLVHVVVKRG